MSRTSKGRSASPAVVSQHRTANFLKRRWLAGAKHRAKKAGIPWALVVDEVFVPSHCPVLGLPLAFGGGNRHDSRVSSPSLDRIIPALGYVPGNVVVVSYLANSIRYRGEPKQIARVAAYYAQLIPPKEE